MRNTKGSALSGFVAGALGGLVGTIVMDAMQQASIKASEQVEDASAAGHTFSGQQRAQLESYDAAHATVAGGIAEAVGLPLSRREKAELAPTTHYLFGTLCGAVYGLIAEYEPEITFGFGSAFGASLFVGASETALPALSLLPAPTDTPPLLHAGGLAAHVAYGSATETVRRLLRTAL